MRGWARITGLLEYAGVACESLATYRVIFSMSELLADNQGVRAERTALWDSWLRRVTSGAGSGTKNTGKRNLIRAYCMIAALLALSGVVNVFSVLYDATRMGRVLAAWEPITWEGSSSFATLFSCGVIYAALRLAPPGQRPWKLTLPIHLFASTLFSALHVGGMVLLRMGVYAAVGLQYRMTLEEVPYEYRKDFVCYLILAGVFWIFAKPIPHSASDSGKKLPPPTFDIVDGSRTLRIPVHDILLIQAAGNYVEFLLDSGRKHLMRATLQEIERSLGPSGFLRTHRSCIINARRVRGLSPAGSGDFLVELEGGAKAPVSRRFREALLRLRANEASV